MAVSQKCRLFRMRRKPSISSEDMELFRLSVGKVNPVRHQRTEAAPRRPAPIPHHSQRERALLREEMLGGDLDPAELETGEELSYARPGMQHTVLRKLRRGHYSVTAELDLHGLTVPLAHRAVADFLDAARTRSQCCVRIIHGKGLNSRQGRPVLKGKLDRWLSHCEAVLAYCSARPVDGGTGAVHVLLKSR